MTKPLKKISESLAPWKYSIDKDDERSLFSFLQGLHRRNNRQQSPIDDDISATSLVDSLFNDDDDDDDDGNSISRSKNTCAISFSNLAAQERCTHADSSGLSMENDRYLDEHDNTGDGSNSSLEERVYIFTDDDSLSCADRNLKDDKIVGHIFRSKSTDSTPELPSCLVRANPLNSTSTISLSRSISLGSWQECNQQRQNKNHEDRMLHQLSNSVSNFSSTSSNQQTNSLWSRIFRVVQGITTTEISRHSSESDIRSTSSCQNSPSEANDQVRPDISCLLSVVGSWDAVDGSVRIMENHDDTKNQYIYDGLEKRTDSKNIVEMLGLGDDGKALLEKIQNVWSKTSSEATQ